MRNTAFLALGLGLLLMQSVLFWFIGFVPWSGFTPSLTLPLIVFMGTHEYSLARGAALACVLGYGLDLLAAAPVGLFTFVSVAIFVLARAAGVRLAAQHIITQVPLAFAFSAAQSVMALVLLAIFSKNPYGAREMVALVLPHAISTAAISPIVFALANRLHTFTGVPASAARSTGP
jgi:rod shape-determining protein MreD